MDRIDGIKSVAVFESIARHVGLNLVPETIFFWRVRSIVVYIGYHQCVEDEIFVDYCRERNIGIVRRILGGGCGFCDENQILFSIIGREDGIIPSDIDSAYKKVLGGIVNALNAMGADGEIDPLRNAVYTNGRKISGNAQARLNGSVLVNGSFLLDLNYDLMEKVLKNPTKNLRNVHSAKEGMITLKDIGIMNIENIKKELKRGFEEALGIKTHEGILTDDEMRMEMKLLEKYQSQEWTYKMDIKRSLRKHSFVPLPQRVV